MNFAQAKIKIGPDTKKAPQEEGPSKASRAGLFLAVEHLAVPREEPAGAHAELTDHRLEPGHLEPATVEVPPLGDQVPPVYVVQAAVCVHATDRLRGDQFVKALVESLHHLLGHFRIHITLPFDQFDFKSYGMPAILAICPIYCEIYFRPVLDAPCFTDIRRNSFVIKI